MVNFSKPFIIISGIGTCVGGLVILKHSLVGGKLKLDPNLTADGKVVIVTGSNTGIGKETVRELAKRRASVYMACRDMDLCEKAREEIVLETRNPNLRCLKCDLADFESVKKFVKNFKKYESRLDVLISNAGVMRCPRQVTKQGIELQLGVNHMGHFLLTNLLLDHLKNSAPSRIVNLSSTAHLRGEINFEDLNSETSYDPGTAYAQSKLANVLFTRELARKLEGTGVTVNAVHPGIVYTELWRHMGVSNSTTAKIIAGPIMRFFAKTPVQGAATTLYAALDPSLVKTTGKYFSESAETTVSEAAADEVTSRRLFATSEKWTGVVY